MRRLQWSPTLSHAICVFSFARLAAAGRGHAFFVRFVHRGALRSTADEGRMGMGQRQLGSSRLAAALAIIAGSSTLSFDIAVAQDDSTVTLPGITVTGTRLVPGPGRGSRRSGEPTSTPTAPAEPAPSGEDGTGSGAVAGTIVTGASTT